MTGLLRKKAFGNIGSVALAVLLAVGLPATCVFAYPGMGKEPSLEGPWEILVKLGLEGEGMRFPVEVSDVNKPQELGERLPVMGTPINVELERYLPDMQEQTRAVGKEGGGVVAELRIAGPGLDQQMWLDSSDTARDSISSRIGSVAIRKVNDANVVGLLARMAEGTEPLGILSINDDARGIAVDYAICGNEARAAGTGGPKIAVKQYLPHYSIDATTKQVQNLSDKPVNPAIEIVVDDGGSKEDIWLWSKFSSPPHTERQLSMSMRFSDYTLVREGGHYYVFSAAGAEPRILYSRDGSTVAEVVKQGEPYPFLDENYSFTIDQIVHGAQLETEWKNGSEKLSHPGIIARIDSGEGDEQIVLKMDNPLHKKIESGTLVLLFRRAPEAR